MVGFGPKGAPALWLAEGAPQRTRACRIRRRRTRDCREGISTLPLCPPAARTTASPASGPSILPTTTAGS